METETLHETVPEGYPPDMARKQTTITEAPISIRLSPEQIAQIDRWRESQVIQPTRVQAIRYAIDQVFGHLQPAGGRERQARRKRHQP